MGIFGAALQRRAQSIAQGSPANPSYWLQRYFSGTATASGRAVDEDTALSVIAVYACVRVIAETVATLPLGVFRRLMDGGREAAPDHPLYDLLHWQPNPEMTSTTFRETLTAHAAMWGNAYAEVVLNNSGRVAQMWPLLPSRMTIERVDGNLVYRYTSLKGIQKDYRADQIFHIPGMGFDGLRGYSVIGLAREGVGLAAAAEEYASRFFGQGAHPGGVLKSKKPLTKDAAERLKADWAAMHQGGVNAHKVAVLEDEMDWQQIGMPIKDMQFIEIRKFQTEEIARLFKVPLHMIGELDRSTNNNIEQQSREFVMHTIRPWLVRWEQAMRRALFTGAEQRTFFAEFNVDGLLRGDFKTRMEGYATARNWGLMSANEIRARENLNPIPADLGGDDFLVPLNMVPMGQLADMPLPTSPVGPRAQPLLEGAR